MNNCQEKMKTTIRVRGTFEICKYNIYENNLKVYSLAKYTHIIHCKF